MTKGEAIRIVSEWVRSATDGTRAEQPYLPVECVKRLLQEVKAADRYLKP